MTPVRDLQFKTWYLNKARLRNWDHCPVAVIIEGKELRGMKGEKKVGPDVSLSLKRTD